MSEKQETRPEYRPEPPPLTPEQATELGRLECLYPHNPVVVKYDDKGVPVFVTPDGEEHSSETPSAKVQKADAEAAEEVNTAAAPEPVDEPKSTKKK